MHDKDPMPRFTWLLIFCLSFVMCICFGITINAFGIYTTPLAESFGATHEEIGRAAGVFFLTQSLVMPLSGWLFTRIPPKWLMSTGVVLSGISCLMASKSTNIHDYVIWIGFSGMGIGLSTYIPAFTLATYWTPPKKHGLVFSIMLSAISAGGIFFPPLLSRLIKDFGWSQTLYGSGVVLLAVCTPMLWFVARLPDGASTAHQSHEQTSLRVGSALAHGKYWLWVFMLSLIGIGTIGLLVNLVPYLISLGFTSERASDFYAIVGFSTLMGNLLFGVAGSRMGARNALLLSLSLTWIGTSLLLVSTNPQWKLIAVIGFCLIWGLSFNAANLLSPILLMEFAGQRNFGTLFGIGNLITGIAAAAGPSAFGYLVDNTKSYQFPITACAISVFISLLPTLKMRNSSTPATTS